MTKNSSKSLTNKTLNEAVDAILNGVEQMFQGQNKRFDGLEKRIDKVEKRLTQIETEITFVKDDIRGLTAEISNTPSRREFNELSLRVSKVSHH